LHLPAKDAATKLINSSLPTQFTLFCMKDEINLALPSQLMAALNKHMQLEAAPEEREDHTTPYCEFKVLTNQYTRAWQKWPERVKPDLHNTSSDSILSQPAPSHPLNQPHL
jgi:hypothetical protein